MKRTLVHTGSAFFIGGTILFGIIHLTIANYLPTMTKWNTPPGKFFEAMNETSTFFPYILSISFMIIGILLLLAVIILAYKERNNKHSGIN